MDDISGFIDQFPDDSVVLIDSDDGPQLLINWETATAGGSDWPSEGSPNDGNYATDDIPSDPLSELSLRNADSVRTSQDEDERREWPKPQDKDALRARMANTPDYARKLLDKLETTTDGWCQLTSIKPSKEGGYIQLSHQGFNKFAVLQDVVLWAGGMQKAPGQHASHLCDQPRCTTTYHVVAESPVANNSRKGCIGYVQCPRTCSACKGGKHMRICIHEPPCIRYVEGFADQREFFKYGVCSDARAELRERESKRPRRA